MYPAVLLLKKLHCISSFIQACSNLTAIDIDMTSGVEAGPFMSILAHDPNNELIGQMVNNPPDWLRW
jgi:hypothetical protein